MHFIKFSFLIVYYFSVKMKLQGRRYQQSITEIIMFIVFFNKLKPSCKQAFLVLLSGVLSMIKHEGY